jgi:hypothetical protein
MIDHQVDRQGIRVIIIYLPSELEAGREREAERETIVHTY